VKKFLTTDYTDITDGEKLGQNEFQIVPVLFRHPRYPRNPWLKFFFP